MIITVVVCLVFPGLEEARRTRKSPHAEVAALRKVLELLPAADSGIGTIRAQARLRHLVVA